MLTVYHLHANITLKTKTTVTETGINLSFKPNSFTQIPKQWDSEWTTAAAVVVVTPYWEDNTWEVWTF